MLASSVLVERGHAMAQKPPQTPAAYVSESSNFKEQVSSQQASRYTISLGVAHLGIRHTQFGPVGMGFGLGATLYFAERFAIAARADLYFANSGALTAFTGSLRYDFGAHWYLSCGVGVADLYVNLGDHGGSHNRAFTLIGDLGYQVGERRAGSLALDFQWTGAFADGETGVAQTLRLEIYFQ